jgi:PAS domain S-box-containing protein
MEILLALLCGFLLLACVALAVAYRRLGENARRNRAQMRALTDNLPLGIATLDREGNHRYANPAYAGWFGLARETLIGAQADRCGHDEFTRRIRALAARGMTGEEETFEIEMAQGELGRRARVTLVPFRPVSGAGEPILIVVISDVSANNLVEARMQEQLSELSHVARLATMGELAAKLAHELNQPLAAINTYTRASLRMMRSGKWESGELIDALEDASLQAERAADIIRGLRNFLRKSPAERRPLDVALLLDEVVRLVEHEARRRRVEVHANVARRLPRVEANRTEIEQVVFNLLLNAVEAIPRGIVGRRLVTLTARADDAGDLEIAVADSGSGFVEGVGEHLFDPFFSTKQDGMGMGLPICRTIVEAHGGELRAGNNAIGGATFRFTLPAAAEEESVDGP